MLFNSITFILFHIFSILLYWLTKNLIIRQAIILISSLIFYAWHFPPALILLLISMVINYFLAIKIEKYNSKKILTLGVILNLSNLGWFKYSSFLIENFNFLIDLLSINYTLPKPNYWLPLGISFYTFQVIGYLVDVYRKEVKAEKSFLCFGVFKCFYSQLIAGPIVRAKEFLPQLKKVHSFSADKFLLGIYYVIAGLAIKIVIADTIAQFVDFGFTNTSKLNFLNAWVTLYGFAFQILSDFWGYSTIAIGLGYMYGINLPLNFKNPYISKSIREFWRRWHITLSFWLRDYLYISLGGNRTKHLRNLFLTMVLGGLWHGSSWNFIFWGAGHGIWLILERIIKFKLPRTKFFNLLNTIVVFHGVCLLWVFFRAKDFNNSLNYFSALLGSNESSIKASETLIFQIVIFVLFIIFFHKSLEDERFLNWSLMKKSIVSITLLLSILAYANAKLDFIYFVF